MKQRERRICARPIEVRTEPDGKVALRGYAAIFDDPAHGEVVTRSAFNRTLAARDDVRLLVNHEGVPVARTKSSTLTLTIDDIGLVYEANDLDPSNPKVQELVSALARGDIDQSSFQFAANDAPTVDGIRELREVTLYDVSIVTFPWYDTTTVGLVGAEARHRVVSAERAARTAMAHELHAGRAAPVGAMSFGEISDMVCCAIEDRIEEMTGVDDVWIWIDDLGPDWAVYCVGPDMYQVVWSMDASGVVTLGDAVEVTRHTVYTPAAPETAGTPKLTEARALLGL